MDDQNLWEGAEQQLDDQNKSFWSKKEKKIQYEQTVKICQRKKYYYECLVIHYKNRGQRKNLLRQFFDRLNNPFEVIRRQPDRKTQVKAIT